MKKIQLFVLQCILLPIATNTTAQTPAKTEFAVEMGATLGSGTYAPLWLTANRQGLSSINPESGYLRAGIFHTMPLNKHFNLNAGLDLATAYNYTSSFVIQQAYVDFGYRWLNLSIGSKERFPELKNPELSSGGLVESNNARPVPQIRLEVPNYTPVPGTNRWVHFKGHIAYGRFTDDKWQKDFSTPGNIYMQNVLYHSKALFAKFGKKEKFPVEVEVGMQLATQFGGEQYISGQNDPILRMPVNWKDYFRVLVPSEGDSNAPLGEQQNILGNHLGSWNLAFTGYWSQWKAKVYYEHYFEDASQMYFGYGRWKDGHLGMEITFPKNRFINTFVYECMSTKDQTGAVFSEHISGNYENVTGVDNYYNHYIYQAWQHWGMGMANPLVVAPIYNENGAITFVSNRMNAHHFGFSGTPADEWKYRVLLSYSQHWGGYVNPFDHMRKQFSSLLEVTYAPQSWKGWNFSLSGAMDRGNMLGNNTGGMFAIRKVGIIK